MTLVAKYKTSTYFDVFISYPWHTSDFYILIEDEEGEGLEDILWIFGKPIPKHYKALDLEISGHHPDNRVFGALAYEINKAAKEKFGMDLNLPI